MAKKSADVKVKILVEVNLTNLALFLQDELPSLPKPKVLLKTPGFKRQLIKYVREDLADYGSLVFADQLEDGLEHQGDLLKFLTKKFNLDGDESELREERFGGGTGLRD